MALDLGNGVSCCPSMHVWIWAMASVVAYVCMDGLGQWHELLLVFGFVYAHVYRCMHRWTCACVCTDEPVRGARHAFVLA